GADPGWPDPRRPPISRRLAFGPHSPGGASMSWRVWLFRSLVCTVLTAAGAVGWLVYLQTNSAAVRAKVIEQVQVDFPGVDVQIGSAGVPALRGRVVRRGQLLRPDGPGAPFPHIP